MLKSDSEDTQFAQNGSNGNWVPLAKTANCETPMDTREVKTPPKKGLNSANSNSVLADILQKKPVDQHQFFDNVLEYFDKTPVVGLNGGNKKSNYVKLPLDDDHKPSKHKSDTSTPKRTHPFKVTNKRAQKKAITVPSQTVPEKQWRECCIIEKLVKRFQYAHSKVTPLAENDLLTYIKSGRPTPVIPSLGVTKSFYEYHPWITGCPTLGRFYCWICLLFMSSALNIRNMVWVKEGFTALNILGTAMTKHAKSAAHREAIIKNRLAMSSIANLPQISDAKANSLPTSTNNQLTYQLTNIQHLPQGDGIGLVNLGSHLDTAIHELYFAQTSPPDSRFDPNILPQEDGMGLINLGSCMDTTLHELHSAQPSPPDSRISPDITPDKVNQGNPVVSRAADCRENSIAFQYQTSQPEICDLTQSEDCGRSSLKAKGDMYSRPKYSSKHLGAKSQYLKLMDELITKEVSSKPSSKNSPPPPKTPLPRLEIHPLPEIDIETLQTNCFPNGTFNGNEEGRQQMIAAGRPTPKMPGFAQLGLDGLMRYFDMSYYDKFPWMCGSSELNRLYCWPCLVFNDYQHNSTWNTVGFSSLLDLPSAAKTHSINQSHLELTITLKMAEESIKSKSTRYSPLKHNEIVRQKRSLLKYLIDAVCFKKKQPNNNETCHEDLECFLKFLSNWDVELKSLLDSKSANYMPVFTPNIIPNYSREITKALKIILKRKIAEEVKDSIYVSFILKTVQNNRTALILRYTKNTGEVHERFYKFIKICFGLREILLKKILYEVNDLKCSAKFVGISYDGGVLSPDQMESFNSNLRNELMAAYFFHYRDENFKDLLQQSLSRMPDCRSFFSLATELGKFLQDNPRVLHCIRSYEDQSPQDKQKSWDLECGIIFTVGDHYLAIMKFMDEVANKTSTSNPWTSHVMAQCAKFRIFLGLKETRLMLVLFSTVYVGLHRLIEAFQGEFDARYWKRVANDAENIVLNISVYKFDEMCKAAEAMGYGFDDLSIPPEERTRLAKIFNETLDWILGFIQYRTKYIDIWAYFDFGTNKIDSPFARAGLNQTQFVMDLKECFPFFDYQKLGSALTFAHNHELFVNKSAYEILQVMVEWDFKSVLPELYSFLLLVQTVPQSSAHVSSPVSGKIASYVEGKTELKSADALCHIEKDLLAGARKEENFYNDVIIIIAELKRTDELTEIDQSGKVVEQLKFMCTENEVVEID